MTLKGQLCVKIPETKLVNFPEGAFVKHSEALD